MSKSRRAKAKIETPVEPPSPAAVVQDFLSALENKDYITIAALLAPDLEYSNVSLPTLRGGDKVARLFENIFSRGADFEAQIHSLATNGDTVMTERTDLLALGPWRASFWVCGTFTVENGRITLWRDYFDWMDLTRGSLRAIAGIFLPSLRASLPSNPG